MGEMADYMLYGDDCAGCGMPFDDAGDGFPRYCAGCTPDDAPRKTARQNGTDGGSRNRRGGGRCAGGQRVSAPTLAQAAHTLAAILGTIVKMSDDVKNAATPLDAQGKLLKMQNSIQKNAARIAPHVRVVLDAAAGDAAAQETTGHG